MIRRIIGALIAMAGLGLVAYTVNELWDVLAYARFDYTGVAANMIRLTGLEYSGPLSVVMVAFAGGLLFVAGCVVMTPMKNE